MTSDSSYLQAATDSANFIKDHLMNSLFQVQDGISAQGNESCATNSLAESHNAGLAIEGLSILYSKTRDPATQTLSVFLVAHEYVQSTDIAVLCVTD
jgi:hypothetical protein